MTIILKRDTARWLARQMKTLDIIWVVFSAFWPLLITLLHRRHIDPWCALVMQFAWVSWVFMRWYFGGCPLKLIRDALLRKPMLVFGRKPY